MLYFIIGHSCGVVFRWVFLQGITQYLSLFKKHIFCSKLRPDSWAGLLGICSTEGSEQSVVDLTSVRLHHVAAMV